jgi:4-hydroxy-tetrahydrodipicolinate reductase
MGREVVRAVAGAADVALVAAVDPPCAGQEIGAIAGVAPLGVEVQPDLAAAIVAAKPEVMVDFTQPDQVMANLRIALGAGVACVVGTTGLNASDLDELRRLCADCKTSALVAPNFAIGAVLMMQFATTAAKHFPAAEIIELHHDAKLDAPSGTALKTAQMMAAAGSSLQPVAAGGQAPSRGLAAESIRVHSVRLPGLVAHQEVIFGGLGETLTIRHDSISRESFMPGVLLAIRKVRGLDGLVYGLEQIL